MSEPIKTKSINVEIKISEEVAQGMYVNMVVATHSPSEFVLDFIFVPPGQLKANVRSRVILSPEHAKRLLKVLNDNVSHYEKRFGEIKLPEPPAGVNMAPSNTVQ